MGGRYIGGWDAWLHARALEVAAVRRARVVHDAAHAAVKQYAVKQLSVVHDAAHAADRHTRRAALAPARYTGRCTRGVGCSYVYVYVMFMFMFMFVT